MQSRFLLFFLFGVMNVSFAQRPVSIEVPVYFSANAIVVSEPYTESIDVKGGFGAAWGLGVKLNPLKYLAIRTGIEFWKNHMEAEYYADYLAQGSSSPITVSVKDKGDYRYGGLYATLFFERKKFFLGGGFQFSALTSYKGSITARDGNFIVFKDENATLPNLAVKNTQQAYVLGMVGFRFGIKNKYFFKPTIEAGLPLLPLFDAGGGSNNDFFLAGVWIRVGLITEIVLKDWGDRKKSRKEDDRPVKNEMPQDRW